MTEEERQNLEVLCEAGDAGVPPGELPYPAIVVSMIQKGWAEQIQNSPVVRVRATSAGCEQIEE